MKIENIVAVISIVALVIFTACSVTLLYRTHMDIKSSIETPEKKCGK